MASSSLGRTARDKPEKASKEDTAVYVPDRRFPHEIKATFICCRPIFSTYRRTTQCNSMFDLANGTGGDDPERMDSIVRSIPMIMTCPAVNLLLAKSKHSSCFFRWLTSVSDRY